MIPSDSIKARAKELIEEGYPDYKDFDALFQQTAHSRCINDAILEYLDREHKEERCETCQTLEKGEQCIKH